MRLIDVLVILSQVSSSDPEIKKTHGNTDESRRLSVVAWAWLWRTDVTTVARLSLHIAITGYESLIQYVRGHKYSETLSSLMVREYVINAYDWCFVFDSVESYDINVLVLTTGMVDDVSWTVLLLILGLRQCRVSVDGPERLLIQLRTQICRVVPRYVSAKYLCQACHLIFDSVEKMLLLEKMLLPSTCSLTVLCPDDTVDRTLDRWLILFSVVSYELNKAELLNEVCRRRSIFVSTSDADTDWLLIKLDEMTEQSDDCVLRLTECSAEGLSVQSWSYVSNIDQKFDRRVGAHILLMLIMMTFTRPYVFDALSELRELFELIINPRRRNFESLFRAHISVTSSRQSWHHDRNASTDIVIWSFSIDDTTFVIRTSSRKKRNRCINDNQNKWNDI